MIVENDRTPTEVHGSRTEAFFSVKQENLAHIFGILRNNLYSDKPRAILREYTTNALDAHVEAGVDIPVEITPPTFFNSTLSIRDFGKGLSEDDVFNVWASYGESTKRNSNSQVGMMGLGSKSAFSYTDSFTIISRHDGMCKTYNAFIDESGIGMIAKVEEEPTDETGIEIQIPIKSSDVWSFDRAIISVVGYMTGVYVHSKSINQSIEESKPNYYVRGEGWALSKGSETLNVIMGGVCYNVSLYDLVKYHKDFEKFRHRSASITFFAEIGDVVPSASRENLNLNDKTLSFIISTFERMQDELKANFKQNIEDAENVWSARLMWRTAPKQIKSLFNDDLTNNGIDICKLIDIEKLPGILMRRRYDGSNWKVHNSLIPFDTTVIYVGKGNVSRNSIMQRIQNSKNYIQEEDYILNFDNEQNANEFLKLVDGAKVYDLADLPYYHRRNSRPEGVNTKADMWKFLDSQLETPRSAWSALSGDLDEGEGIYIPIKHHQPIGFNLHYLSRILNNFNIVAGEKITLIGIREADVKKLGSGWTNLDDYIKSVLDSKYDEIYEKLHEKFVYESLPSYIQSAMNVYNTVNRTCPIDMGGLSQSAKYLGYNYASYRSLITAGLAKNIDASELSNEIINRFEKYPMLKAVDWHVANLPIVEDYIRGIDMGG
jgi:hypothetical protein